MIYPEDLRINNIVLFKGMEIRLSPEVLASIFKSEAYNDLEPVAIDRERLVQAAGFTITDFGDFYQLEKDKFVLIQPKMTMLGKDMPFICRFQMVVPNSKSFTELHKLQNFYYETVGEEMIWQADPSDLE